MDDNFCFNLKMEEFAKITARSLSAFKRDFMRVYGTTPGKWLMEKRLNNAFHLLTNMGKTVSELLFKAASKVLRISAVPSVSVLAILPLPSGIGLLSE